jgi:hypothetical protein
MSMDAVIYFLLLMLVGWLATKNKNPRPPLKDR